MIRPGIRRLLRLPLSSRELAERETEEEVQLHLQLRAEQLERRGLSPEAARAEAARRFGPADASRRDLTRTARRREGKAAAREWVGELLRDLRFGARQLLRNRGFALATVLTLALAIGGTTAIFGVVDAIFLRYPAGITAPEEVVQLRIVRDEGSVQTDGGPGSYLDYEALRSGTRGFAAVAGILGPQTVDLGRGAEAEQVRVGMVTQTYLPMLGVRPALGRLFLPDDTVAGASPTAVVSHGFWRRRLGADPAVLGHVLELNGQMVTVVGVMAPEFTGLDAEPLDAWVPITSAPLLDDFYDDGWQLEFRMAAVHLLGRLAPGTTAERAAAEAESALRAAAQDVAELDPTPGLRTASLIPGAAPNRSPVADLSLWLALVAGMVLVIAAANVANLLLARSTARTRELAVRASLGAGRARLLRQHLTESLLLALIGGALGLAVAHAGNVIIRQFPVPPSAGRLDARVLGFALAVSLGTGLLFGLLPALRAARVDPAERLREGRSTATPGRGRLRRSLVALQVAMSLVLLVGAGLFVRSLRAVHAIDPGVDVERLTTVTMDLGRAGIPDATRPDVQREALERIQRVPGVSRAAMAHFAPFGNTTVSTPFRVEGRDTAGRPNTAVLNVVSAGYFETVGTRVLAGRGFTAADEASTEPIAVVNRILAREIAPDGNAVGRCVALWKQVMEGGCTRIVGVVEETRGRVLQPQEDPQYYVSWDQDPAVVGWGTPTLLVRTDERTPASAEAVRAAVQGLRPDLPYVQVQPLGEAVRSELLPFRLGATLFSLFAALALAIAAVGIYGVLAYFVTERTREIGIRRSLGAPQRAVLSLVVRQGMAPVALGLGVGLGITLAGSFLISSLLFGVHARDPLTFAAMAAFLAGIALVSTLLPARRAVSVNPMSALRQE